MAISEALGPERVVQLDRGPIAVRTTGDGPPVLFLHGIIANGDLWRRVVPHLEDSYTCITPDWPLGSHRLAMHPGTDFTLFGLADIVADLIGELGGPVTLVANDTGGAIAQAVAARHPECLSALVLTPCDAFENFPPPVIRHLQVGGRSTIGLWVLAQSLRFRVIQRLPIAFGWLTERPIPAEIMRSFTEPLRTMRGTRRDFAQLVRSISTRFTQEAALGLATFPAPALILWALEPHRFFPLDDAHRLAHALPDATVEVVPNSGPFLPEDQPEALARHVRSFLTNVDHRRRSCHTPPPASGPTAPPTETVNQHA